MGFSTLCCRNASTRTSIRWAACQCLSGLRALIIAVVLYFTVSVALAASVSVGNAAIAPSNEGYFLDADFNLRLNGTLEDALSRGVVLYFVIEGRLWRPRWWWFNDLVTAAQLTRTLSYNSLTRQYRLSNGREYQNFSALEDAETALGQVRDWKIADAQSLDKTNRYRGSIRMWLDVTQLPKPFQVKAVTAKDWSMDSDDFVFDVNI